MSTLETKPQHLATSADSPPQQPFISVIVPVRNEARCIAHTLDCLSRQSYAPDRFEIIVVDGRSTDETCDIVRKMIPDHANLRLLDNPQQWSSSARNIGIRAAQGELVVIVDGHCDVSTNSYLSEVAAAFARTGADCLGRPQPLEVSEPTTLQRAIGFARASRLGHHPDSHVFSTAEKEVPAHSVAVAYRRSVFDRIGLFDESFDACEDVELNHRVDQAGMRCFVVPALRVSYHPRATLRGLFRQMDRYGRGRVRLLRKHPATFSPLGFVPALFLAFALFGSAAAWWSSNLGLLYVAGMAAYACVVMGFSLALVAKSRCWSLMPWLPVVFATLHVGAGAGILREFAQITTSNKRPGTRPDSRCP